MMAQIHKQKQKGNDKHFTFLYVFSFETVPDSISPNRKPKVTNGFPLSPERIA
jgi:hypothetical protein